MYRVITATRILGIILAALIVSSGASPGEVRLSECRVFSFDTSLVLPGSPEEIFDAFTGDVSGWWDHSFSTNPYKFHIEPWPGGGFYEIFDEEGNGVLHATVIYSDRGKMLRFEGPLGLSGRGLTLVCTFTFEASGEGSTTLKLEVRGSGDLDEGHPAIIEQVWHHFLFERFRPYVESGAHRGPGAGKQ